MLIEELLNKGFNLNHKPVQHPGIRGGKGYYTNTGKWVYGIRPVPKPPHIDYAYGVTKLAKPVPISDLALTINKHFKPYLEKMIGHEEFFNTGVINLRGEFEGNERKTNKAIDEAIEQTEEGIRPYIKPGFTPRVLGAGVEAMAIDLGDKVARIQVGGNNIARWTTSTVPERPKFPWMLQALDKGETKLLGWEILPRAELVNKRWYDEGEDLANGEEADVIAKDPDKEVKVIYYEKVKKHTYILSKQAEKDNYDFADNHPGNIGYVNGKPIIIDPGAVAHFDPDTREIDQKAQAVASKESNHHISPEDLEKTVEESYIAINNRGYKVMDKTVALSPEKRVETWKAVDAVTSNVEQAFPDLKDIMSKQPLVINVSSVDTENGVRGEHHPPLYQGAPNVIDINAQYSRTFMHELGHYLDSAAAILHPSGQWDYKRKLSDLYGTPIFDAVAKLKGLPEYRQWIQERPVNQRAYWTRNSEVFARFFDQYMYHKLGKPPSDSYEPYTDQELEEVGKLMEDGLRKLKLLKAFINLDRLSKAGWIMRHERKPVERPGSRGSTKWYRTKEGVVEYGDRPSGGNGIAKVPVPADYVDGLGDVIEEVLESYLGSNWKKAIVDEWENNPERQDMINWVFKETKIYGLKGNWTKKDVADYIERSYSNTKSALAPSPYHPKTIVSKPAPIKSISMSPTNGPGYNFTALELQVLESIFGGGSSNFLQNIKKTHLANEVGELGLIHYLTHQVFGQGKVIKTRPESMTSKQAREGLVNLLASLNPTKLPDPVKPGAPSTGSKPKPANYRIQWMNTVIDANIREWLKSRMPMQDEAEALDNLPINYKKNLANFLKEKGINTQNYGMQGLDYDYADRLNDLHWQSGTIKELREQFLPFDFPEFPAQSGVGYAIRQWREKQPESKVKNAVDFYADLTDKQRSALKEHVINYIINEMSAKDIKLYFGSAANLYPETEDLIDDFLTRTTDKQFKRKLTTQHRGLEKEAKAKIGVIGPTGKWIKSSLPEPEFLTHYSEDSTRRMWASIATNYDLWQSTEDDDRTSLERWYNDQNTTDFVDTMLPYFKKQVKIFGEAYVKEFIKKTTGQGMAIANSINVALYNGEKIDQYGQPVNEQAVILAKEMYDYGYNEVRDMSYKWGQLPETRVKNIKNSLEQLKKLHSVIPGLTELVKNKKLILQLQDLVENGDAAGLYQGSSREDRLFGILSIDQNEESTLIHEVGHFIDNALAGKDVSVWFGSNDSRNELYGLLKDIKNTNSYQSFIQGIKDSGGTHGGMYGLTYYETPTEVFSRFFASEILHRTGRDEKQRQDQERYSTAELDALWPKLESILKNASLVKAMVSPMKPPETMRPVKPVHIQSHVLPHKEEEVDTEHKIKQRLKEGMKKPVEKNKTLKSLLSYGIEPRWMQDLFKAVHIIKPNILNNTAAVPESKAEQEAAIGTEGGKFFVDKFGKKHYGPYGPQPIEKPKAVEDQVYLHEQAEPVPPPKEPEKPKSLEEEIADFQGMEGGTVIDFVIQYGKTHHDEVIASLTEGNTMKLSYKLSDKLKEAGYNDMDTDPLVIDGTLLYSIPTKERGAVRARLEFLTNTNPDLIYKKASDISKTTVNSIVSMSKSDKEQAVLVNSFVNRMVAAAIESLNHNLTDEQHKELTEKYTSYINERVNATKEMRKNTKVFSHTIQIADIPARPPTDATKDPDTWEKSGPAVEAKIRAEHSELRTRVDWKILVSKQIGKRMIDMGISEEMAKDYFATVNHYPRTSTEDVRIAAADDMVSSWAVSADGSNALSLAMQRLTSEVFPGAARWDTMQPWNNKSAWDWSTKYMDNPVFKQVATAFLYAQYQNTQDYFKQLGVTQVTIGRGAKTTFAPINQEAAEAAKKAKKAGSDRWVASGVLDEDKHISNPLSSWGWDSATNSNFAGGSGLPSSDQEGQPIVISMTVPISRVIGGFFSGNGAEPEHEVVLIGSEKPVDKVYWAAWNNEDSSYDNSRDTAVSVAQKILEGTLPTTESMNFITPAMEFRSELKSVMQQTIDENWDKMSEEDIMYRLRLSYNVSPKGKTIVTSSGQKIGIRQAVSIVHSLLDEGYGLSHEKIIDNIILTGGLTKLIKEWYKKDEDQWMGKFEATTAKNILQDPVNKGIISEKNLPAAIKYLTQQVKQQVEEEAKGVKNSVTTLADTTPNKVVYAKTKEYLNKEENKGIVQGIATGISQGLPYDADSFVKGYLFEAVAKHMGVDKDDITSLEANLPTSTFSQSVKDAFQDAVKEYTQNEIKPNLSIDLDKHIKNFLSKYDTNVAESSDTEVDSLAATIAQDFKWSSQNKNDSKEELTKLVKPILSKLKDEAKTNMEDLTGPKLDAHITKLLSNPNLFKTPSGKFTSFTDVLTMAEDVTNNLMKEANLDPDTTPYYKKIKDEVKLRLRKEYKKQLQEAHDKGLPLSPVAEATLGKL